MTVEQFATRHIGPGPDDERRMLEVVGHDSIDELMDAAIPEVIRWHGTLDLPDPATEAETIAELRALAARNTVAVSMIGLGYHGTHTPAVIRRNVLEDPAWYTAYTPYQPEISQGRLEALLNFQTMVTDLTGLATANASMLDEGTAAAEAMTLARRASKSKSRRVRRRRRRAAADHRGDHQPGRAARHRRAGPRRASATSCRRSSSACTCSTRGRPGRCATTPAWCEAAHAVGALVTVAADLLALTLLRAPGEIGADIAAGTTQRFGVPMGFGGPHAGYLAVRSGLERMLPGRLVGVSRDADGNPAYRLALQTREQHIRREKATSNICTAQVLLAVMAGMYAVYHGPDGLRGIADAYPCDGGAARGRAARRRGGRRGRRVLRHRHRDRARAGRRGGGRRRGPGRQPAAGRRRPGGGVLRRDHHRRAPGGGVGGVRGARVRRRRGRGPAGRR